MEAEIVSPKHRAMLATGYFHSSMVCFRGCAISSSSEAPF